MIISFEGLDGCGKSTQIDMLKEYMISTGRDTVVLREPGSDQISEKIRDVLLDNKNEGMFSETELLLYIASRTQLVRSEIIPLSKSGKDIILDRYVDSTTAYQGYGRKIDLKLVDMLNSLATRNGEFLPDITFYLDISTNISVERIETRNEEVNRIENAGSDFFNKTREGFLSISKKEPDRVYVIDGSKDVRSVHLHIIKILRSREFIC